MRKFDPRIHHRQSIRLPGYDYASEGSYFITICTQNRRHLFGHIEDDTMFLNDMGQIIEDQWLELPTRFPNVGLGSFIVMPNHVHYILDIFENHKKTMGDITGAFKSLCIHEILERQKKINYDIIIGKIWQRNLWEHIIRSAEEWERINQYILNNPKNWDNDKLKNPLF
jgi:putative transposase